MDVRISIVNYNTRDLLDACLASIFRHPPEGDFEVVVVDNASTDDSVAMVRERFPQVRLIASRDNLGYAGGNNLALRSAPLARYSLILNSDIEVHPGCLQRLVDHMDAHPEVGVASARLILPDGSVQLSCAREFTVQRYATQQLLLDKAGVSDYLTGPYWLDCAAATEPFESEQVSGACLFVRREALAEVGLMDEGYWMYCEDSDWCRRFRQHGWPLVYVPDAVMDHRLGGSSTTARAEMIAAYNHAAVRYLRRHGRPGDAAWGRLLGLAGAKLRLSLWVGKLLVSLGRDRHAAAQVRLFWRTLLLTWRRGGAA